MMPSKNDPMGGKNVIRSCRSTVVIFAIMATVFILPSMYFLWLGHLEVLVVVLYGLCLFATIFRYRVSWNKTTLSYRGVWMTRCVMFADISKFDVSYARKPLDPTVGLRIFSKSTRKPSMIINLKPFSRGDISLLMTRLRE